MTDDTKARILRLIDQHLCIDASQIATAQQRAPEALKLSEIGADSLDVIELTMAIEEEFNIEITDDEADPFTDIEGPDQRPLSDLIELVDRKRAAVGASA